MKDMNHMNLIPYQAHKEPLIALYRKTVHMVHKVQGKELWIDNILLLRMYELKTNYETNVLINNIL